MQERDTQVAVEEVSTGITEVRNLAEIPFMLGGLTFPVPPRGMRITQSIKMDEVDIPKKSGKVKQPTGYENAKITVELDICNEESATGRVITTALERVRTMQKLFRKSSDALPEPYEIVSPLTEMVGVKQVLILEIEVTQPESLDYYPVTFTLEEYNSIKTQLEHAAASKEAADGAADAGAEAIEGDDRLNRELGYVRDQFNAGMSAGVGVEAPGDDTQTPPEVE